MHNVLISLASNHQHRQHLSQARQALADLLVHHRYTTEIWTEPEGKTQLGGIMYLNQIVSADTTLTYAELHERLKHIETGLGRNAEARRHGIVPIDLDILRYDGQRHHLQDWQRSYVQQLMEELEKR